jgi:hypothetical protein
MEQWKFIVRSTFHEEKSILSVKCKSNFISFSKTADHTYFPTGHKIGIYYLEFYLKLFYIVSIQQHTKIISDCFVSSFTVMGTCCSLLQPVRYANHNKLIWKICVVQFCSCCIVNFTIFMASFSLAFKSVLF